MPESTMPVVCTKLWMAVRWDIFEFLLLHLLYLQVLIVAGGSVPALGTRLQSTEVLDLSQE